MNYNKFLKWNRESHYSSFSFQFHFKKKINYNKPFGYPFYNDYNVIILPISNYVEKYTKDKNIKKHKCDFNDINFDPSTCDFKPTFWLIH